MVRIGYNSNGFVHSRLDDMLGWMAELGYEAVALSPDVGCLDPKNTGTGQLRRLGARLSEMGMTPVIETGARYLLETRRKHRPNLLEADESRLVRLNFLRRMVEWANLLGAPVLTTWSGVLPEGQSEACARDRLQEAMETLYSLAERRGVALALEPEPGHWIATLDDYRAFRDSCPGLFRLTLDVGHLLVTGEAKPHEAVKTWRGEIAVLQLDDMRSGVHAHLAPGEGDLDWKKLRAAVEVPELEAVPACFELSRDSHRVHEMLPGALAFWRGLGT